MLQQLSYSFATTLLQLHVLSALKFTMCIQLTGKDCFGSRVFYVCVHDNA